MCNKLEDEVLTVVEDFMRGDTLFTALDVSNKVKMTMPFVRHREVRDLVRQYFTAYIEPAGWAKTPITVTLGNGTTAEALLYHPLSDSWDLDTKYDDQKRTQSSVKPVTQPVVAPVLPVTPPQPPPPPPSPSDRWAQLFDTQPSLFPTK